MVYECFLYNRKANDDIDEIVSILMVLVATAIILESRDPADPISQFQWTNTYKAGNKVSWNTAEHTFESFIREIINL